MNKNCTITNNTGFTLLEILVSIAILSVGLLGLTSTSTSIIKGSTASGNTAEAVILAQDKLEEIRNLDFADAQLTATTPGAPHTNSEGTGGIANPISADGSANGIYTRTWTVADFATPVLLKKIDITVTWTDTFGTHNAAASTIRQE